MDFTIVPVSEFWMFWKGSAWSGNLLRAWPSTDVSSKYPSRYISPNDHFHVSFLTFPVQHYRISMSAIFSFL